MTFPNNKSSARTMVQANSDRRRSTFTGVAAILAAASMGLAPMAQAQTLPPNIPLPPAGSPIQRMTPQQMPSVSPGGLTLEDMSLGEVPDISIPVRQVILTGATLFDAEVRPFLDGLTGPSVPLARLDKARQEILRYYRSRGYALTSVHMAVSRTSGLVELRVIEGRIVSVKLDGDIGPAGSMVLRFLNHLTEYAVINSADMERYLLLAQDVPGVSVSTVLEPSKTDPGALTMVAQVALKRVSGQLSFDNRAYDLTGPIEGLLAVDINSLTAWGDKTELSFFHSFPNSQNFGQASSEWFLGSGGLKLKIYGGAGQNIPTGSLAAVDYKGWTDIFGTQLSYPVIRARQQNLNVYVSLDALESTIDSGSPSTQESADEVRALRIGEEYIRSDLLLSDKMPATNVANVRISHGLDFLGGFHGTALPPATARQGEKHNFTDLKFELSRTQTLFSPWSGASVALMTLVTGQWTDSVLPPSEQFYLGGARFTRGYYAGQVPGDKALAATAELQLNTTVDLTSLGSHADVAAQFYVFYDWGETWQNQSVDAAARVASAGGGVRLQITRWVELDLEALGRMNLSPPPSTADMNGIGLYWRLVGRY